MRLLSWIFQPVYLIFFLIISALYIYRGELIPEHRNIEQSRVLSQQVEQAAKDITTQNKKNRDEMARVAELRIKVKAQQEAQRARIEAAALSNSSAKSSISELSGIPETDSPTGSEQSKVQTKAKLTADKNVAHQASASENVVSEDAVKELEVIEQDKLTLQSVVDVKESLVSMWYSARKAAWGGDKELAIERYQQLTSSYPQHADGFGELGNIYYAQGVAKLALESYRQALDIYQTTGQSGSSMQLQKAIVKIETEMAKR